MKRSEWHQVLQGLGLITQLGLTVVLSALIGGALGGGVAWTTGLGAPAMVGGILLGVAAGALGVYRLVMAQVERSSAGGAARGASEDREFRSPGGGGQGRDRDGGDEP